MPSTRIRSGLCLLAALAISAGSATADERRDSYDCRPAQKHFCQNIHISCSGVTRIPTAPFRLTIDQTAAVIDFTGAAAPHPGFVSGTGDLVVALLNSRDWIRIETNGRYSHRIYHRRGTSMSSGHCRPTSAP